MVFEFHQPVRQEVQESILILLLLCFIVIRMVWWCDGLVTEQLSPWHSDSCVSVCHLYPCTTVPIITFTVSVWSFMFSVGYKSSTAHVILPYDCRLCIMTKFSVIKSTWTWSFKSPSLFFQCGVFQGLLPPRLEQCYYCALSKGDLEAKLSRIYFQSLWTKWHKFSWWPLLRGGKNWSQ